MWGLNEEARFNNLFGVWCDFVCGGATAPTVPAELPVSIEGLDGETDISVGAKFVYSFDDVDEDTIDNDTFFIVEADCDSPNNTSGNALDSTKECEEDGSETDCTITPDEDLEPAADHCITRTIGILDNEGDPVFDEDLKVGFTTEDGEVVVKLYDARCGVGNTILALLLCGLYNYIDNFFGIVCYCKKLEVIAIDMSATFYTRLEPFDQTSPIFFTHEYHREVLRFSCLLEC